MADKSVSLREWGASSAVKWCYVMWSLETYFTLDSNNIELICLCLA